MSKCQKYWKIGHNAKSIAGLVSTAQTEERLSTRQSASSPTSGDELENIIGTQVDEVQYVDSQGTTVEGDDDSQQQSSPGSSSGSESAEDKTRFRSR